MSPSSVQQRAGGRGPPAAPCGGRQKQHSGCGRPPGGPAGSINAHAAELARRRPSVARPPLPPPHCSAAADPARPRASPRRSGLWALKKKNGGKFPVHPKQEKAAAEASKKPAKFYAAGPHCCRCRHLLPCLCSMCEAWHVGLLAMQAAAGMAGCWRRASDPARPRQQEVAAGACAAAWSAAGQPSSNAHMAAACASRLRWQQDRSRMNVKQQAG